MGENWNKNVSQFDPYSLDQRDVRSSDLLSDCTLMKLHSATLSEQRVAHN